MYQAKRRGRSRSELYTDAMRAESRRAQAARRRARAGAGGRPAAARLPADHLHPQRPRRRRRGAAALGPPRPRHACCPRSSCTSPRSRAPSCPIGDWVIRQACLDTRAWLDAGLVDRGVQRARQRRRPSARRGHLRRAGAGHGAPDGAQPAPAHARLRREHAQRPPAGQPALAAGAAPLRRAARARQLRHRHLVAHRAAHVRGRRA